MTNLETELLIEFICGAVVVIAIYYHLITNNIKENVKDLMEFLEKRGNKNEENKESEVLK